MNRFLCILIAIRQVCSGVFVSRSRAIGLVILARRLWIRPRRALAIAGSLVATLIVIASSLLGLQLTTELFTGWLSISIRVLPQAKIDLGGVGVFVVGFVIAAICLHVIAVWLSDHINRLKQLQLPSDARDQHHSRRWSLGATVAALIMILSGFVVGISMAGVVHQTGWIINSPDGIAVSKVQSSTDARLANYDPTEPPVGVSWITACAPYVPFMLEHELVKNRPFNDSLNAENFKRVLSISVCPSQGNPLFSPEGFGLAQVAANPSALGGTLSEKNSTAIMFGEVNKAFDPWGSPTNQRDPTLGIRSSWNNAMRGSIGYGSVHSGGANVCLVDGSVKFVDEEIDPVVLKQLAQAKLPNPLQFNQNDNGDDRH